MIDWEDIRQECIRTGKFIKIEKKEDIKLPSTFHETQLGLAKGAIRQYRDERPTHSLHVHEFPDYYLAHVDTFNPEYHPVAHGIVDTPGITLGIIAGAVGIFILYKSLKNIIFIPKDDEEC